MTYRPEPSTPFVLLPTAHLPKAKTHPVVVTASAAAKAADLKRQADDAVLAAQDSTDDLLTVWERDRTAAVARIAAGEAVTVAARPSEADAADRLDTARRIGTQARINEIRANDAADRAIAANLQDLLPSVMAATSAAVEDLRPALTALRTAASRLTSSRSLALDLRATQVAVAMRDAKTADKLHGVETRDVNNVARTFTASILGTAATSTALADLGSALHEVEALLDTLAAEDLSAPFPTTPPNYTDHYIEIATALGLSTRPSAAPETREAFNKRYSQATALGRPVPRMPAHLGGLL